MKKINLAILIAFSFLFSILTYAQESAQSVAPALEKANAIGSKVVDVSHNASIGIDKVADLMASKEALVMTVLMFLFGLAKRVSTENSGPIVALIQKAFDAVSMLFISLGNLLKKIAEFMAKLLASDGIAGKK